MPYLSESINEPSSESEASSPAIRSTLRRALTALETGDFYARWEAAKTISACGVEAAQSGSPEAVINPLLHLLWAEDSEEEISWYIARILGTLNHPLAVQGLTHLLQTSQSSDVAVMAATALANCGTAAISPLTDLLHQPKMKLIAIRALAQIEHPDVVPILLTLTSDSLAAARSTAIDALSRFSDPAILEALFVALRDSDSSVRRSAVGTLGFQAQTLCASSRIKSGFRTTHSLDPFDTRLIDVLKPLLWDLDLDVCCQTALALGRIGTSSAISALSKVLQSANTPVLLQQSIIRALGWSETPEAISCLKQALFHNKAFAEEGSLEIITVFGRFRQSESCVLAVQILLDLLHVQHSVSQTSKGRQTIAHSFGQMVTTLKKVTSGNSGNSSVHQKQFAKIMNALIDFLEDADTGVRLHTIAALKAFDDRLVNSKLAALMQSETISLKLREGITVALAERQRSII